MSDFNLKEHFEGYKLGYSVGENNARDLKKAGSNGPEWWIKQFGITHKDKLTGFHEGYQEGCEDHYNHESET